MEVGVIRSPDLSDREFHHLSEIISMESGIKMTLSKKSLVQARLMRRMRELRINDYGVYIDFLGEHYNDEIVNLINCITTNKTEFFRENFHFQFMREKVLPEFLERKMTKLRVWCAGCSTGEEPYTIAITLCEFYGGHLPHDTKILATDIDTTVLDRAQQGIYTRENVNCIEESLLKKYFLRGKGSVEGKFQVKDSLKRLISFRRLNLLSDVFPMKGTFDIIFCRNVVIYFDRESQKKLFTQFHRYLDEIGRAHV